MKIFQRYLLKEFFSFFVILLFGLSFVMLLGNLVKLTDLLINKGVDLLSILKLFVFNLPYLFSYILPISILSASLMSLGRLSSDNEIIALRANGISTLKILLPFWLLGIIFSLVLVIFNSNITAYAHYATKKTLMDIGVKNPASVIEPGVFIDSFQGYVLFVYEVKQNKLYHIRIYELQEQNKPARIIVAKKGEFLSIPDKKIVKLKLIDGSLDEPDPNNPKQFYRLNFKNYFLTLNFASNKEEKTLQKKPKDMTLKELKEAIQELKKKGIISSVLLIQIQERFALSFSAFVFMLLGTSLALLTKKRQKTINFGISFVIIGSYYLFMVLGKTLCLETNFSYLLGTWLANIVFGLIGTILTFKVLKA